MDSESRDAAAVTAREHKAAFFRHSGWLMVAGVTSGMFSWGVHFLSKKVPDADWGIFVTLLAVIMFIPGVPLQMVFAQQTAAALATGRERQLRGMIRFAWGATLLLCLAAAVALFAGGQDYLMKVWKLPGAAPLWVTLGAILFSFWFPIFCGLMQGQQNFFWLGNALIVNGLMRIVGAGIIVIALQGRSAGLMVGVTLGMAMATILGIWQSRKLWMGPVEPFDWRGLLAQVIPLMLGFAAFQFMFAADTVFVKSYFEPEEVSYYGAAGTLSRALLWLVGPLTAVMFPKIVHSVARSEKTDVMSLTLICTAVLAVAGAVGLWLLGPWVVRFVYKPEYVPIATAVLPWYAAAMLPYCLANVLVNNLLARSDFRIVPVLVAIAIGYAITISFVHSTFVIVLQILGAFNLLLLIGAILFTRRTTRSGGVTPTAISGVSA
jgi:O-antigen/teichoic acid export membrane protein